MTLIFENTGTRSHDLHKELIITTYVQLDETNVHALIRAAILIATKC